MSYRGKTIDQHIKGFEALGAEVVIEHGAVSVNAENLHAANIFFDVVSVGATINVMIAATMGCSSITSIFESKSNI